MGIISWLQRQKQSRGHGVHSPFAFHLITRVIHSPHAYYAFYDIPKLLEREGIEPRLITPYNHLTFRLQHHFKPANVLEINTGEGVNTLFLRAAHPGARFTCVENDFSKISVARKLHANYPGSLSFVSSIPSRDEASFDAIYLRLEEEAFPTIDTLLRLGHEKSFWVIHPIRKGAGKLFWKEIVNDERINATFTLKETGIAFPWPSLTPCSYRV